MQHHCFHDFITFMLRNIERLKKNPLENNIIIFLTIPKPVNCILENYQICVANWTYSTTFSYINLIPIWKVLYIFISSFLQLKIETYKWKKLCYPSSILWFLILYKYTRFVLNLVQCAVIWICLHSYTKNGLVSFWNMWDMLGNSTWKYRYFIYFTWLPRHYYV
jgi:hypothetical protein